MQAIIIDTIVNILSGIKINKISDKEVKTALVKDYLLLKKAVFKVAELRSKKQPLTGHEKFLEAEADTIKMINEAFAEEIDVEITTFDLDVFIAAVGEEALTLETIAFLQDNGVIV